MLWLATILLLFGWSASQQDYVCTNATITGNLQITVLVNKHYGSSCDTATPESVVDPLSGSISAWSNTPLSGSLTIGLRILDVCGDAEAASKLINDLVPWRHIYDDKMKTEICSIASSPFNIGLISTVQPTSYELTTLLDKANIPLVIAKDGYSTETLQESSSTFALGNSIDTSLEILSKFMVELNWDYLTVVHSQDAIGQASYQAFKKFAAKYYFCIDSVIPVSAGVVVGRLNTSGVVYLGSEGIGLQVLTSGDLQGKTWVTSLNLRGLTLSSITGEVYSVQSSAGDPVTDALVVLGRAINQTAGETGCSAANVSVCGKAEFRRKLVKNMQAVMNKKQTYHIDTAGRVTSENLPADPKYEAFLYPTGEKVANISLEGGVTSLVGNLEKPSLCDPSERLCESKCGHLNKHYMYIHGEVMIVVSIPVHNGVVNGSCDGYTKTSLLRAEVARFAFQYLKDKHPASYDIGMLVFDSCADRLTAGGIVYDILRGNKDSEICEPDNPDHCFDHNKIAAFVGDFASAVTQQLETALRYVPMIHLAYGSTSTALNDRDLYPYFLRTTPSDVVQAHYMAELFLKIRDKGNEVSAAYVIYSDELYGNTAYEEVKKALEKIDICIHKAMSVKDGEDFDALVKTILDEPEGIRFIITFLDTSHLVGLMEAIDTSNEKTFWIRRGYSFILSDTWGDNNEYLMKYGDIVKGSFSFKINVHFKSLTLNDYLSKQATAPVNHINPWLSTLEQEVGKCKVRGNFLGEYSKVCNIVWGDLSDLTEETFSLHLMKALTAIYLELRSFQLIGLHYIFDPARISERYESILRVKIGAHLEDGGANWIYPPFTQNTTESNTYGNGAENFAIFNIDKEAHYVHIFETKNDAMSPLGSPKDNFGFQKDGDFAEGISSTSEQEHCLIQKKNGLDSNIIALIAVGCFAGLLLAAIAGYTIRRRMLKRRKQKQASVTNDTTCQGSELYTDITNYPQLISSQQEENLRRYLGNGSSSSHSGSHLYNADPTYHVPQPLSGSASRLTENSVNKPSTLTRDSNHSSSSSYICPSNRKATLSPPTPAPRGNSALDSKSSTNRSQSSGNIGHPLAEEEDDD